LPKVINRKILTFTRFYRRTNGPVYVNGNHGYKGEKRTRKNQKRTRKKSEGEEEERKKENG